mmetsp:Transcript_1009/g.1875  ORF Transcript_1009/g.1875 Transcript_1009/m.1875 type:complete len:696 (-) Transcript_1009:3040-5127(-)
MIMAASLKQSLFLFFLGIVTVSHCIGNGISVDNLAKVAFNPNSRAIAVDAATFLSRRNHSPSLTFHERFKSILVSRGGDAGDVDDDEFLENEDDHGETLDDVVGSPKKRLTTSVMSSSQIIGDPEQKSTDFTDDDESSQDENMAWGGVNTSDKGIEVLGRPTNPEPLNKDEIENGGNGGNSHFTYTSNLERKTTIESDNIESSISGEEYDVEKSLLSYRGSRRKSKDGDTKTSIEQKGLENDDAYDPWEKEISRMRDFYRSYRPQPEPEESSIHGSESEYIERGDGFIRLRSNSHERQKDLEKHFKVQPDECEDALQSKKNGGNDSGVHFAGEPPKVDQSWTDEGLEESTTAEKPVAPNGINNHYELDDDHDTTVFITRDSIKGVTVQDDADDDQANVPDINIMAPEYANDNTIAENFSEKSEEFSQHESSSIVDQDSNMEDSFELQYRWEQSKEVAFNKLVEDGLNRLRRKKGDQPSVPYVITRAMRQVLIENLGYQEEEVAAMRPDVAVIIVGQNLKRPSCEDLPPRFYNEPVEQSKVVQVNEDQDTILEIMSKKLAPWSNVLQTSWLVQFIKPCLRKMDVTLREVWHGMTKKNGPKYTAILTAMLTVTISFFRNKSSTASRRRTNDYFVSDSQIIPRSIHKSKGSESIPVVRSTNETDETVLVNENPELLQDDLDKTWLDKLVSFISSAFGA